jgi:hypothetical protein
MPLSFRSSLLLAGALAASITVLGACSAPSDSSADDEIALGDDELNTTNNKMGLRLRYDEPTGRVRATLKTKLKTGEKLRMRVRRGRLSNGAQTALDCSQLADAVPLAVPLTTTTASKPVYEGPELDRSLLACVYTQQWIDGNLSAPVIEQLSRDGADAIVDACIVPDARDIPPRARLQTSLQYAWDTSDPNVNPLLVQNR